jgi:hypothetical protein
MAGSEFLSAATRNPRAQNLFADNAALVSFIQRVAGYTLTASPGAQCLFFCYGAGAKVKLVQIADVR